MRFLFSLLLVPATALAALLASALDIRAADRRPNIVFILADDLGWTDVGCMGSRYYETPSIDRLAGQGMRLMNYHNCQNCAPTRAVLMSGQYPPRTGVYTVGSLERGKAGERKMAVPRNETNLPLDRKTIADQLQAAGYATGLFGKWHLGQAGEFHPSKRGFDEAIVSAGKHFDFRTTPTVAYPEGTYLADFLTDKAVDFIDRHKEKPFFLYLPHFGVHSPYQAKKDLIDRFETKPPAGGHHNPTYAAMIQSVDESVGRVMAKLDALNLSDNTVFIFSSDNGGVGGYGEIGGRGVTHNAPLRGGKGMLYEGGTRVPFIVRWPGFVKPGTSCDAPTIHVDFYATLLDLAAAPKPAQPIDGESMVPLFKDPSTKLKRDSFYVHFPGYLEGYGTQNWRTSPVGTIQSGEWKLLEFFETNRLELYNLQEDLGEKRNLAGLLPGKVKELHSRLIQWRNDVGATMPRMKTNEELESPTLEN